MVLPSRRKAAIGVAHRDDMIPEAWLSGHRNRGIGNVRREDTFCQKYRFPKPVASVYAPAYGFEHFAFQ